MSSEPTSKLRRAPMAAIAVLALAWIALLAWLVLTSANPVIVNRVQVQRADVIVAGDWQPGSPARIAVQRAWKKSLAGTTVQVRPPDDVQVSGRVVVPLTRISPDLYEVTHGELANTPARPGGRDRIVPSLVRPYVYPDTQDVARQIDALLSEGHPH